MLEQNGPVANLSLTIDFSNARIDQPVDDTAFKFEIPEGAKCYQDSLVTEVPPATIAPHSDPAALKLTKLWTAGDLKDPGNVLVIDGADGQPHIYVFDGWRSVAELDGNGQVLAETRARYSQRRRSVFLAHHDRCTGPALLRRFCQRAAAVPCVRSELEKDAKFPQARGWCDRRHR